MLTDWTSCGGIALLFVENGKGGKPPMDELPTNSSFVHFLFGHVNSDTILVNVIHILILGEVPFVGDKMSHCSIMIRVDDHSFEMRGYFLPF